MAQLTHLVVIRRDLTFGEYSAQLDHGGEAYYQRSLHEGAFTPAPWPHAARMGFNETTSIIKGARNETKLLRLESALKAENVPHIAIREEPGEKGGRLAGQLTCISLMPCEVEQLPAGALKALNEFHRIEALDGPKAS